VPQPVRKVLKVNKQPKELLVQMVLLKVCKDFKVHKELLQAHKVHKVNRQLKELLAQPVSLKVCKAVKVLKEL